MWTVAPGKGIGGAKIGVGDGAAWWTLKAPFAIDTATAPGRDRDAPGPLSTGGRLQVYLSGMTMVETPVKQSPKIGQGLAGPGRPAGVPNRSTRALKDAILLAAEMAHAEMANKAGDPPEARVEGSLEGYLSWLAVKHPQSFAPLLGRIIPIQIKSTVPLDPSAQANPAALGAAIAFALRIGNMPGRAKTIEHEEKK